MRILLADDDTGVIQALLAILKSVPGYEIRVATTGERALENAAALGGVDLLITDVVMEPMDGFTLRDEVVARFPGARTILISGYDLSDYPEQTQHHQTLAKPVDRDALLAAIEREFAPPPAPVPVAVPVAVPRPIAVPQARMAAAQPTVRAVAAPVARPAAVPQAKAATAQPTARPVAQPVAQSPRAVPQASAQPTVKAVPAQQPVVARPVAVPQPTVRPVAQPVAQAPRAVAPQATAIPRAAAPATAVPRAVAIPQATAVPRAVAAVPVAQPQALKATQPMPVEFSARTAAPAHEAAPEPIAASVPEPEPAPALPEPEPAPEPEPEPEVTGLPGRTLGAYQILRQLGEGRWGTVYAAVQTAINRPVGLKVLSPEQAADPGARARFIADARAKAHVQHPSILAVYEAGEAAGHFFYAHEYVEGRTMAEIKASGEKLDEQTALKVLHTAADGLAYLSIHKIPHTPPEPGGIFLGADGGPRLANIATQLSDQQLPVEGEIQALGRVLLGVLPAIQSLTPGMQHLVKRMVQKGPQAFSSWGPLLQAIKALEPKVVPVEASKISAQDRAAVAAVLELKKKQTRSLYISLASLGTLIVVVSALVYWRFASNERLLDEQVHIPAGEFPFGESADPVTLPEFWIDKYEVTYGQYAKFVAALQARPTTEYDDPRQPRIKSQDMHKPKHWEIFHGQAQVGGKAHSTPIDLNCPVMEVDWWDAFAYAKWMGRELPTEQEWEKAARGTQGFIYPWGDEPGPKKANSNTDFHGGDPNAKGETDGFVYWNPVDKNKSDKSPFGVIGMAGNVAEWIATWDTAKKRPIFKGGSFMSSDNRLDSRKDLDASIPSEALGFRTVTRTPPAKK